MHNVSTPLVKRGLAMLVAALLFAGGAGLLAASAAAQTTPRLTGAGTGLPLPVPTSTAVATATATPCPIQFTDVPPSDPSYVYIRCLACRGILTGYADGTFLPANSVTRGQTAKIVANAAGYSETPGGPTFAD